MSLRQGKRPQHPTHPLSNSPDQPDPTMATEESTLQTELYSRALFLELAEQAQGVKRHYSSGFWFDEETRQIRRNHHELASSIKTFLDGMATFLGSRPGVENVTACALEVCVDEATVVSGVRGGRAESTEGQTEAMERQTRPRATEERQAETMEAGQAEATEPRQIETMEESQIGDEEEMAASQGSRMGKARRPTNEDYSQLEDRGSTHLTASQLNSPKVHSSQKAAYTITLRISRNENVPKETIGLAEKLLLWIRKADVTDAALRDLHTTIASTCRLDIQSKLGGQPESAKMKLIKKGHDILNDCDYPTFNPDLENQPVLKDISEYIYTPRFHQQAFDTFTDTLSLYITLLERILESGTNTRDVLDAIACAYSFRKDRVIAYFVSTLGKAEREAIMGSFEKLGSYYSHILHFTKIASLGPQHHLGWVFHSTIKVCVTTARQNRTFAMKLDDLALATLKDDEVVSRLLVPTTIKDQYRKHESANTIEHCEMQLVRFYIENPMTFPVVPYLGVSKLSCYCCDKFLKNLQHPEDIGYQGPPIEFAVRGTHGKIYSLWRPPVDMETDDCVRERVNRAVKDLTTDLDTLCNVKMKEFVKARTVQGDGPGWSSPEEVDEQKELCTKKDLARIRNALSKAGGRRQRGNTGK